MKTASRPDTSAKSPSRDKGQSFLRVFKILIHLASADRPPSISELSIATGLPRPTVFRVCSMLEQERLVVRQIGEKRYGPGPRLWEFAADVIGGEGARKERELILREVVSKVGETCNLTIPNGTAMLYVDRVECNWPLRLQLPVGSKVPLHSTPSGKLYLTYLPRGRRIALLARLTLEKHTPNTITSVELLEEEFRSIRKNAVAFDREEFVAGMHSVAVPIMNSQNRLWATLAIHGPTSRFDLSKAQAAVPTLRAAAAELQTLGSISPNRAPRKRGHLDQPLRRVAK